MKLKIQKLSPTAKIPEITRIGDGDHVEIGIDLYADQVEMNFDGNPYLCRIKSGIAIETPEGYYFQLVARSSVYRTGAFLANGVGIIDPSYRGEIMGVFRLTSPLKNPYSVGDRFGQLVLCLNDTNRLVIEEVDHLSETTRGSGGFGSTGK